MGKGVDRGLIYKGKVVRAAYLGQGGPGQGQAEQPGALFAPRRRLVPVLLREQRRRPYVGVPLQMRCIGEAGGFSFLTRLVGYEGSGRMLLAVPLSITHEGPGTPNVPGGTGLEVYPGDSYVPTPLTRPDRTGLSFAYRGTEPTAVMRARMARRFCSRSRTSRWRLGPVSTSR